MKYNFARAMAQTGGQSLKGAIIEPGTVVEIGNVKAGTFKNNAGEDEPNDQLVCSVNGANRIVSVREYLKMTLEGGGSHYEHEGEEDTCDFPEKFSVVKSEDRKDQAGNTIYPVTAYKAAEAQLKANNIDWNALVASGLRDDHGLPAVQNYTIKIM